MGWLTGCVQDLAFSHVNRDTADALLANGCEVLTPRAQFCCGSIHAHNGELELAKQMARRNLDAFDLERLDAVITNAAGCGTHLKNYGHLLQDDPAFMERAMKWSAKVRDIHEWLVEIGIRAPAASIRQTVTYHEACHLCHGQKITREPRQVLKAIPGLELGGATRIKLVLRQRRRLQHRYPAGDVANAPATQDAANHCDNRSSGRSVSQPGLFSAIAGGRTRS